MSEEEALHGRMTLCASDGVSSRSSRTPLPRPQPLSLPPPLNVPLLRGRRTRSRVGGHAQDRERGVERRGSGEESESVQGRQCGER
jgi:hypothetical protein